MWASRLEPSPPLAQAKAKAKLTKVPPKPRLASLHWCQDLNHALHSIGHGLINFRRENQPEAIFTCPPEAHPKMLIICSDQESTQIASVNYLLHHRHCYLLHVPDPGHRGWNDQWLALGEAGLSKQALMSISLFNIKFGPWGKSGFGKKVQELATVLSTQLSPNDELLMHFFPSILKDQRRAAGENEQQHRSDFLASLPSLPFVTSKGPKASSSRFHSLIHAHNFLDESRTIDVEYMVWFGKNCF